MRKLLPVPTQAQAPVGGGILQADLRKLLPKLIEAQSVSRGGISEASADKLPPAIGPVGDIQTLEQGRDFIALSWTRPDTMLQITGYQYTLLLGTTVIGTAWTSTGSTQPQFIFRNLTPGERYTFRIRGVSGASTGDATEAVDYFESTLSPGNPSPPVNVSVVNTDGAAAVVSWVIPIDG